MLQRSRGCIVAALLLHGCATGSTAFRTFSVEKAESVSIDAKQRTVLMAKREGRTIVCAEPSPDALAALGASLGASGGYQGAQAALSAALSENTQELGVRNATIQLLRDALYRACEGYLNGALNDFQYTMITSRYADIMITLLAIEQITSLKRPTRDRASVAAGGTVKTNTEAGAAGKSGSEASAAPGTTTAATITTTVPSASTEEVVAITRTVEDLVASAVTKDYRGLMSMYYYSAKAGENAPNVTRNTASDKRPPLERYCDALYAGDPSLANGKDPTQ